MAHRENIRDRVIKLNPDLLELYDKINEALESDDSIEITEDMTYEEIEMQHLEHYMNRGMDYNEAKEKTSIEMAKLVDYHKKGIITLPGIEAKLQLH